MSTRGAAGAVERIQEAIREAGVNRTWLSDQTGIAYSTLTRKLTVKPEEFRLGEIAAIADVLGLSFDVTFIPPTDTATAAA